MLFKILYQSTLMVAIFSLPLACSSKLSFSGSAVPGSASKTSATSTATDTTTTNTPATSDTATSTPAPSDTATSNTATNSTSTSSTGTSDPGASSDAIAAPTVIACTSSVVALQSNQSVELTFSGKTPVSYSLSASPALPTGSMGGVTALAPSTNMMVMYYSPAKNSVQSTITITAIPTDTAIAPASCTVRLIPDGALGVSDDGKTKGLVGNVFNSFSSGDYSMTFDTVVNWVPANPLPTDKIVSPAPASTIVVPCLNVPNTYFMNGFPGVPHLVEWFAIRFDGQILIPTTGTYEFAMDADDGALVYFDGNTVPVVNDDGVHSIARASGFVHLTAGKHNIHIDYFEGPKWYIAATLYWQGPNDSQLTIVPAAAFSRPLGN